MNRLNRRLTPGKWKENKLEYRFEKISQTEAERKRKKEKRNI